MAIGGLVDTVREAGEYSGLLSEAPSEEQLILGLSGSQKSLYVAAMAKEGREELFPTLVLTHSRYQADKWIRDLSTLLPGIDVLAFPGMEIHPHEEALPDARVAQNRLRVLTRLAFHEKVIVVSHVQAVSEKLLTRERFRAATFAVGAGDVVDLDNLLRSLSAMGYERVERVDAPGHFSHRGGIVDVFPFTHDQPLRLDFFDDVVDSIRAFNPVTQRSETPLERVVIAPAREFLYDARDVDDAVQAIQSAALRQARRLEGMESGQAAETLLARVAEHVEKIRAGMYFEGIDQYEPFFTDDLRTLLDFVGRGIVIVDEPARSKDQLGAFLKDVGETHAALLERGRILPEQARLVADWDEIAAACKARTVYLATLDQRTPGMRPNSVAQINARPVEHFHGKIERLAENVRTWKKERYRVCLLVSNEDRANRIIDALKDYDVEAIYVQHLNGELKAGNVVVTTGELESGAEFPDSRLAILTDAEIFGHAKRRRRRTTQDEPGVRIADFADLRQGDYVVHTNHGIGKYLGVETLEISGVHKDYLVVRYAGEDKLYVPTDQVDLLQRYIGVDGQPPKLNKLGGNEWARVKKRVKESVQEMAEGLLKLYAERETIRGYSFSPDTVWQTQFEDAFPYEETPDQQRAIEEVKRDMERPRPMDRLLCGDVGYGKTEVAIRAAFKAVMDGKQVAVLVPTTILAQQHGRTFQERFEAYPVRVRVLSRFQSAAEQTEILKAVAKGSVDIVIGTHRLLSKDVSFKDLGLVVVDEEQRFGVTQKERLKELRKEVDVLTLSATPIPRTLHMAMVGVRDMSLIATPPEDRFPIRTFVVEWDEELIREAILRELGREGQVYLVYNRVQSIDRMASRLAELTPEARIGVAHGQMDENQLESVMLDFLHGEYDVLVCSTIIETGMDIANVNTLIVYDADHLGLAQLYQLRGRVGRSNRVAYAYFTYRRDKALAEDAEKRLQAIKEFTDLGSGFKIAMRDLEIRGAGNILGAEQHGFIASVGFELYCRLLDESIKELKGEMLAQPPDPTIDLNVDAYLSDEYIADSGQKVEIYKKVAGVRDVDDVKDLEEELEDRFGTLPPSAQNLLAVARIKCVGRRVGVASIASEKDGATIKLFGGMSVPREASDLTRRYRGRVLVSSRGAGVKIRSRGMTDSELLAVIEGVLVDLAEMIKA